MNKTKSFFLGCFMVMGATAFAGGLVTNTNQNASFLRMLSQDAIIDITGLYMNPAGTAFLAPGHHFSFNVQNAKQSRNITTTFPLFAQNLNDLGNTTHKFEGKAYAPVIPSIQYSYNTDGKWSFNVNFALGGGGGKCEFDDGLGSFEALYAGNIYTTVATNVATQLAQGYAAQAIPQYMAAGMSYDQAVAAVAEPAAQYAKENLSSTMSQVYQGYSLDAYMKGKQYYFGLSLGATYKAMDNLAVFGGVRAVYAMCNYNGFVQDVKYSVKGQVTDANSDLALNADQTGLGFTPMLGVDWKINDQWNIAAKYEFKTRLRLENKSEMNDVAKAAAASNATLGQFADGTKIAADIPSVLTAGVQYSPIKALRFNTGFHYYGDKNATQYGNKQDNIDKNTWEITAGAEYDINKYITASCGWQTTQYGLSDAYMNDLSFNTNSNSFGIGFRVNASDRCYIDFGYMLTKYDKRAVDTSTAAGTKSDVYERTNRVLGVGLNFKF